MRNKVPGAILVFLLVVGQAAAQPEIDPAVISPQYEATGADALLKGIYVQYRSGGVDGSHFYLLPTNIVLDTAALPPGVCKYATGAGLKTIYEHVTIYRGSNTFGAFQTGTPFTRFRVVSPCFDGRFGEVTEQDHRTHAYGGGTAVFSPVKSKFYTTVNRTRTQPGVPGSTGGTWSVGDFDEMFIGARTSLATAATTPSSTSGQCRGQANPPPEHTCNPAFDWKTTPMVKITGSLMDPVDGQLRTFTAVPPQLAAYNTSVAALPMFQGAQALSPVLFGLMEFGSLNDSGPTRLAAVLVTDSSTTVRPSQARLYFKRGSSWIPMNTNGTFPSVPDNMRSIFGINNFAITDLKFSPVVSRWRIWGAAANSESVVGCDDQTPGGASLAFIDLHDNSRIDFWGSQNVLGRFTSLAHYVFSGACNCMREFIFYTSVDQACYNHPQWHQYTGIERWRGMETAVRRWLDGPPDQ